MDLTTGRQAARHVVATGARLLRRRADERTDAQLLHQLTGTVPGLPAGLQIQSLGTAGYAISCQGTTVLIDPYATRLSLGDLLRRRVVRPSPEAVDRWIPRADAVLVGHTHFDHALDAPAIARRDRCALYGSTSMEHLLGLYGLQRQATVVEPHRTYEVGPFAVTFVPSVHAKLAFGLAVPNGGELTCQQLDQLTPQAYGCGQVWGFHIAVNGISLYHQGSADLIDDEIRTRGVDVAFCGIAGRQFTPDYLARTVNRLDPAVIVPTHFDDFFRPLDATPGFALGVQLARFVDDIAAINGDITVAIPPRPKPSTHRHIRR